jgi:hypothetical protein
MDFSHDGDGAAPAREPESIENFAGWVGACSDREVSDGEKEKKRCLERC